MRPDSPLNGSLQRRCLGLVAWRTSVWRSSLRVDKQIVFLMIAKHLQEKKVFKAETLSKLRLKIILMIGDSHHSPH